MTTFNEDLQRKIDLKTKPLGALGKMERLAYQIGTIQGTLEPQLENPHILLFAADHGIAQSGVSAYPPEVTFQMVMNILGGGAAVTVFSRQNGIAVKTIDAGVNYDFGKIEGLIDCKVGYGTRNFLHEPAMGVEELEHCLQAAAEVVNDVAQTGCNVIGFGEMGIGNTSSASMIMHYVTGIPLVECVGRGTGVNDEQLQHKLSILQEARIKHGELTDPKAILSTFGGYEVAQICGAMLAAYRHKMILLIDGFIATSALLIAKELEPSILDNAVFCHNSNEVGHQKMLASIGGDPILHLDMRVGEGTGCALAYPILQNAVAFLNQMASFESAGVANKD